VKTFERVPGATVSGQGAAPNETLTASVQMRVPQSGNDTQFVYRQQTTADENGEFSFTLPYSTTGYDEFGPENGYTNVTVQSTGPYRISGETRTNESAYVLRNGASLNVSEADVNGAGDGEVSVELSERVLQAPGTRPTGARTRRAATRRTGTRRVGTSVS
jgi:dolichyl-diphosphooligosaccharide--protein glycosyltransferase